MNTYHYIYQITNKLNGHIYVGVRQSAVAPENDARYMGSGILIKNAINKYGLQHFEKSIISLHENRALALAAEAKIVSLDFVSRADTYNLKVGGEGGSVKGRQVSSETRKRLSESKQGRVLPPFSEEHRQRLSAANKGVPKPPKSEEQKQKLSESLKGRPRRPHSEETKRKISESRQRGK